MSTQPEEHGDDCPLCGGTGEVSISKDGTDKGTDYYGCPVCICRERDEEEARLRAANVDCFEHFNALKAERDELLEALKACADWLDWLVTPHDDPKGAHAAHIKQARAAISRAEAA